MRCTYVLNRKGLKAGSVYALNNGVRLTTRVYGICVKPGSCPSFITWPSLDIFICWARVLLLRRAKVLFYWTLSQSLFLHSSPDSLYGFAYANRMISICKSYSSRTRDEYEYVNYIHRILVNHIHDLHNRWICKSYSSRTSKSYSSRTHLRANIISRRTQLTKGIWSKSYSLRTRLRADKQWIFIAYLP